MVRLKDQCFRRWRHPYGEFQFHNGSIKRGNTHTRNDYYSEEFQFHNGSIKSPNNQQKILYQTPRYFYKEKIGATFKSRQRPVAVKLTGG